MSKPFLFALLTLRPVVSVRTLAEPFGAGGWAAAVYVSTSTWAYKFENFKK